MALKITCPHCGNPLRLEEPYPLPGTERQCACGRALSITYPMGMMELLRGRGARFATDEDEDEGDGATVVVPTPAPPAASPASGNPSPTVPLPPRAASPPPPPPTARTVRPSTAPPAEDDGLTVQERRGAGSVEPTEAIGSRPGVRPSRSGVVIEDRTGSFRGGASSRSAPPRSSPPPSRPDGLPARQVPTVPIPGKTNGGKGGNKGANKGGGKRRWFLGFAASGLGLAGLLAVLGIGAVVGVFWWYSRDLPTVEALGQYRPPTVTVVYDAKGRLLGEIYEKRRYVVPLEQIPAHQKQAFLAAEDAGFYEHGGVDYMGIVRAVARNAAKGKKAQGASTITQQVARNFLLSNEKTFERKIREVLLAWRIEEAFDKDHILYLYLNQIYLGSGAYGVEAAARVYFGKHVEELDLAEAAMIAGLPQRPSDYSPHRHFDKAKARQRYVLDQMVEKGFVGKDEADAAYAKPLDVVARTNEFLLMAPWFTEHIRRYLVDTYGEDRVLNEGLVVESTCDLDLQKEAQRAVTEQVTSTDEKVGWRGPAETLAEDAIAGRIAELAKKDVLLEEGKRFGGVVVDVKKKHLVVDLGAGKAIVPLSWTEWAYKPDPSRNSKYRKQDDLTRVFQRGDVVTVEIVNRSFRDAKPFEGYAEAGDGPFAAATIYQEPEVQGALWSYRLTDGAVLAMVGGVDFKDSKFNRAVQASRQVGSTFKPIVYAAAIESKKFTPGTIVQDAPLVFNTLKSQLWKPENYGEDYLGDITLRNALAQSRNVVTIRVLDVIGLDAVYQMARRLGLESPMDVDLSMGLGSASLKMPELARAYSAFPTLGKKVEPHYVERVLDRDGKVLEQWQKPDAWEQVLDPNVAAVMNWLLQDVATSGTAAKAAKLGLRVGGKTGTTNDFHDAWFVGYTAEVLTAVWVGYDQPKSLGASSTGGHTALPIWMDYMEDAVPKEKDKPFPAAPNLAWVSIDEKTGRPMQGGRSMPFLAGTAPTGAVAEAGQKTTEDLLTTEF